MGIRITVTGKRFDEIPLKSPELLKELGLLAERLIRTRTEQMVDVHGAPFRPLSMEYAKQKAAAGLTPVANLTVSGRMLNDMGITEITDRSVSIGFSSAGGVAPRFGRRKGKGTGASTFIQRSRAIGAADKAFFHTETGAGRSQVVREFFGLSDDDEAQLEAALDAYIERVINS